MKQKRFMNSRKGQITIFIIIGIILLFSTATVLYIKNTMTEKRVEDIVSEMQDVPVQVQPVRNFVDGCLSSVSKNAIKLIGMHGGYIDISIEGNNYTNNVGFDLDVSGMDPTSHEAIQVLPDIEGREGYNDYYVPFWLYMSSKNDKDNIEFKWAKPTLTFGTQEPLSKMGTLSIQEQIELYVENNIDACLANFARFSEQGFNVVPQNEPEAFVVIAEDDVVVALDYELDIEDADGDEYEINRFRISHDVQLRHIFDFSMKLLEKVTDSKMFEKTALNIIAAAGDIKGDIPPAAGMELAFFPEGRWLMFEIQENLQFYLQSYIPMMKVYGAYGSDRFDVERRYDPPSLHNKMFLITGMEANPDFGVSFQYFQDWPIYLHIYKGQMVSTSDEITFPLFLKALGGIFQYNTPYDISFPVKIQITEPDAFRGEGYTFNFFYESNIRDNVPITPAFNVSKVPALGVQQSMACDIEHRNSGNITVEVTDEDGKPLKDATIHFGARDICMIGPTTLNEMGTRASLTSTFPVAVGRMKVAKFGYMEKTVPLITALDKNDHIEVKLIKKRKIPEGGLRARVYDVNKRGIGTWTVDNMDRLDSDCRQEEEDNPLRWVNGNDDYHNADIEQFWFFDTYSEPGELRPNETLIINMERKKQSIFDPDINPTVIIEYGKPSPTIEIIPGEYKAQFMLIRRAPLFIPECKECMDLSGCDWDDMQAIDFSTFPESEFTINLTIEPGLLYGTRGLEFTTFRLDLYDVPENQRTSMDLGMWDVVTERLSSGEPDPITGTDYSLLMKPKAFAMSPEAVAEELEYESLFD